MTAADDFLETATAPSQTRPEPKRNQWGQYVIPDPDTNKERGWVRATTWCKTVAETFALEEWGKRCVALGLAARPDLLLSVKAVADPESKDGKRALNRVADDAKEASGASIRANIGTALHAFAEQQDQGLKADPGPEYRADLEAYHAAKAAHGIIIRPEWMERVVIVPELGVAGTLDRLVEWTKRPGLLVDMDLKTGRTMEYSWAEAIIQQVLYTRASHWVEYDDKGNAVALHEMPAMCQDRALIAHLPAGEKVCRMYELVQMEEAWRMASQVVPDVRAWRKRKDLAQLLVSDEDDPFADAANTADGATDVAAGVESPGNREALGAGVREADSPAAAPSGWDPFGDTEPSPAAGSPGDAAAAPALESTAADEGPAPTDATGDAGAPLGGVPSEQLAQLAASEADEPFTTAHEDAVVVSYRMAEQAAKDAADLSFDVPSPVTTTGGDADGLSTDAADSGAGDEPAPEDRTLWLRRRLKAMRGNDKATGACARLWPHDIPTKGPWTAAQLDELVTVVERAEAQGAMPFPEESDPARPAPERRSHTEPPAVADRSGAPGEHDLKDGRRVAASRRADLQALAKTLGPQTAHVMRWLGEASKAGCGFDIAGDELKERVFQVATAAVMCADNLTPDEDTEQLTRAVLSFCWPVANHPEPWDSTWSTGAAFGRLTKDAAEAVQEAVQAFRDGDATTVGQVGQHAVLDP